MIARLLAEKLWGYATQYPVVSVVGPRQSGKTTLCQSVFKNHRYVSLEDLEMRSYAMQDPRGFLATYAGNGVIVDEAQHAPDLFSYIQTEVDRVRAMGRFILTGSQQFLLNERIAQSLSGRVAITHLLPFSFRELSQDWTTADPDDTMFRGFYPPVFDRHLDPAEFFRFYLQTYVERDVRSVLQVSDLAQFVRFLKLCAGRVGQLLNTSSLGNEAGVSHTTVRRWLSVLESSSIIKLLPPWHANVNKRLVKSPKLYFVDVGLATSLLNVTQSVHLQSHPLRGALFENMLIAEALKQRTHLGLSDNLYFYRDQSGNEVDLLLDHGNALEAVEIKSSQTIVNDFFKGLNMIQSLLPQVTKTCLVYGGRETRTQFGHRVCPWFGFL